MFFKLTGSVLILLGTSIWGFSYSNIYYKRHKNLMRFIVCLTAMENEISFTKQPIEAVLKRVSDITEFKEIFLTASNLSCEMPIKKRWELAVLKDSKRLYFKKCDTEIISMLGGELGMTDRDGQIKNIRHIKKLTENLESEAKEEYQKQSKLLKGLGVSVGLFLVILLL